MSWNENVHCTRVCRLEDRQQKASEARSQYQFHIISGQQLLQTSITPTRTTFSWNTKLVSVSAFIFAYSANPHVFSILPPSYFNKQQVPYKGESWHSSLPVWEKKRETAIVYSCPCCFVYTQWNLCLRFWERLSVVIKNPHSCSSDHVWAPMDPKGQRSETLLLFKYCSHDALLLSLWPFGETIPTEAVKTTQGFEMIPLGRCEDAPGGIIIPPGGVNLPGTELGGVSVWDWPRYTLQHGNSRKHTFHRQHSSNKLRSLHGLMCLYCVLLTLSEDLNAVYIFVYTWAFQTHVSSYSCKVIIQHFCRSACGPTPEWLQF